jgi:hypothetical protein
MMRDFTKTIIAISGLAIMTACQAYETEPAQSAPKAPSIKPSNIELNPLKDAYFGDLHVHTKNSFDAFIFGTRATPDDAYRFAKGATIKNGAGADITLSGPPLDFLAVTDHGEYIGIVPAMRDRKNPLSKTETAKSIFGLTATDRRANFLRIGATVVSGDEIKEIYDNPYMNSVWAETVDAAERHNAPGTFTTFAGYEFTAMTQVTQLAAANIHRNVIFKDEAPTQLFTTLNSPNPEHLWDWMNKQRMEGREVIAIPHNSNASNGQMFADVTYDGSPLPVGYAANRLRNEPLAEITQLKGTSETHPSLSPNDEWSNFEQYEYLIGSTTKSTPDTGSFVRPALGRGLSLKDNPYKFGLIGSSDTHLGAGSFSEKDHFGKFPHDLNPGNRQSIPPKKAKVWPDTQEGTVDLVSTPQYGASGLAGVWAEANTREALFEAMQAKETFATSGPRIRVRMFAGKDYNPLLLARPDMIGEAYENGVPMGGTLKGADVSPDFMAWAMMDPTGTPLQRLQIIKVTADGERIYDVACANGQPVNPETRRCADNGARVDLSTCTTNDSSGAAELKSIWQDPDYKSGQKAAYYLRALENPKCRWSTWDAVRNGTPPSPYMQATLQDRAWGSPIWVTP